MRQQQKSIMYCDNAILFFGIYIVYTTAYTACYIATLHMIVQNTILVKNNPSVMSPTAHRAAWHNLRATVSRQKWQSCIDVIVGTLSFGDELALTGDAIP
jgi:hypothetical protein